MTGGGVRKATPRTRFWAQAGRGKGGGEAPDAEQAPRGRRIKNGYFEIWR